MSKYINSMMQISAASVVMMSAVFAADQTSMSNPPVQNCQMGNLCSNYPVLNNGYSVHMDIGYILEQFVLTGTDFGYTTEIAYNTLPASVDTLRPKFNVASGVTAELGYFFEYDCWFLNSRFDWVTRKGHKNWTAEGSQQVVPVGIWTPTMIGASTDATYFTSVDADLKVSYYDLQVDLNRGAYITKAVAIEPHAGLKAAWIYYTGDQNYTGGSAGVYLLNHHSSTSFWGLGPDFGVNSQWNMCKGFSLFCDTTVALLFGGSNVKDSTTYNSSATRTTSAGERLLVVSPNARAMLGFQYNTGIFDQSQNIRFRLALDTSYYWNQFQNISVANEYNTTSGSISKFYMNDNNGFGMIGMIVELGWDF